MRLTRCLLRYRGMYNDGHNSKVIHCVHRNIVDQLNRLLMLEIVRSSSKPMLGLSKDSQHTV